MNDLTVRHTATGWAVVDGDRVIAGFDTNGQAWRWLDRQERRALHVRRDTADWTGQGVYYEADPACEATATSPMPVKSGDGA